MKPERDKNKKFTASEWKHIRTCMEQEDPLELVEIDGERVVWAVHKQWPSLYSAWRTYDRAEAEFFYAKGNLDLYLKHLIEKEQQCQSET